MATTYCTAAQVRAAAMPRSLPQSDDEIDGVILLAEKDVDRKLPDNARSGGVRKIDVDALDAEDPALEALADATAAQVLYRLHMGHAFFVESYQAVGGKDYQSAKAPPKFSVAARDILIDCGLMPTGGRAWSGYGRGGGIRTISQRRWTW